MPRIRGLNEATVQKLIKAGVVLTSLGRFKPVFAEKMEIELAVS